jgi:hypothetical protein
MHMLIRTILTTVIAASFVAHADFADAAKKKRKPPTPPSSYAPGPSDQRVYGAPIQGPIVTSQVSRTSRAKSEFQRLKPCPSTGKASGTCPGYSIAYRKSLKSGGANTAGNMEWKATQVAKTDKTAAAPK